MHTFLEPGDKGFYLTNIGRMIYSAFEQKVTDLGYTRPQWQCLAYLSKNPGLTQVRLAEVMELEPITLSRHLDRMEADGLVERRTDPRDRRVKRLYLTSKASEEIAKIESVRDNVLAVVVKDITPEQEKALVDILSGIRKNLLEIMR